MHALYMLVGHRIITKLIKDGSRGRGNDGNSRL